MALTTMHRGQRIELLPVPIRASAYMNGIQWGRLGTPEQAVAKQEMIRMLTVYERFGANQCPVRLRDGRTVWSVKFPANSRWASGPERTSAFQAIIDNYAKNKMFQGYMMSDLTGPGGTFKDIDAIVDRALAKDNAMAKGEL